MINFNSNVPIKCDPSQAAFITIDFQNFFCDFKAGAKYGFGMSMNDMFKTVRGNSPQQKYKAAAQKANSLLPVFRQAGAEIIHVRMRVDGLSDEDDSFYEIEPIEGIDKFARKAKPNAFHEKESVDPLLQSDLHRQLQKAGVSRLFMAGVHTDACVLTTAMGAVDNGYEVALIEDCTAERSLEHLRLVALQEMRDYGIDIINARQARRAFDLE